MCPEGRMQDGGKTRGCAFRRIFIRTAGVPCLPVMPVLTLLEAEGYRVTRVDVERDIGAVLGELKPDVAFNALHGPYGEDGMIQGVLEYLQIPYTHSGV